MKYQATLVVLAFSLVAAALLLHFDTGERLPVSKTDPPSSLHSPQSTPEELRVTFLAVGDILLSRQVAARIEQNENPLLPFSQFGEVLISSDFNFGNLESPVSGNDRVKGRGLIFNTSTADLEGLVSYSLGNFVFDQGHENTREGLVLRIVLKAHRLKDQTVAAGSVALEKIELIPVIIQQCCPRRATDSESQRILQKIGVDRRVITPAAESL